MLVVLGFSFPSSNLQYEIKQKKKKKKNADKPKINHYYDLYRACLGMGLKGEDISNIDYYSDDRPYT